MNKVSNPSYRRYLELKEAGNCLDDLLAIYDLASEDYFLAEKRYEEAKKELKKAMYNIICYNRFHNTESDN